VKFPFLPNGGSYADLFEAAGNNLAEAARLLLDLVTDFVDPEMKAKRLVDCEHEGDRITHSIYSRLNSTFVTPIDREDIYLLAGRLDDVVDSIEAAADMLVLHRVVEPIEPVVQQARLIDTAARDTAASLVHLRTSPRSRSRATGTASTSSRTRATASTGAPSPTCTRSRTTTTTAWRATC
jgi:uncharacterized protein